MIQRHESTNTTVSLQNKAGSITIHSGGSAHIYGRLLGVGIEVKKDLFDDFVELVLGAQKEITP